VSELGRHTADLESEPSNYSPDSTTPLTGSLEGFSKLVLRVLLYPTPQGALTQLWAGTSPETANLNGGVSGSASSTTCEAHPMCCSISSHGRESVNLAAMIHNWGGSFGLGSKNRLRTSDHTWLWCPLYPVRSRLPSPELRLRLLISVSINETDKGNGYPESGTSV